MACVLRPRVRTTYLDKGEHCPGRGFESVVCSPRGTRVENWHATCRMGECCAELPRGHLGGSLQVRPQLPSSSLFSTLVLLCSSHFLQPHLSLYSSFSQKWLLSQPSSQAISHTFSLVLLSSYLSHILSGSPLSLKKKKNL